MIKRLLKSLRNSLLATASPHRWRYPPGSLLVLTYHRVLPRNFADIDIVEPGMFVYDDTFEMHLQLLARDFDIVDLADWLQAANDGRQLPQRACAITFDDGWKDNYDYAYPLLSAFNAPATIFAVTGMIGTSRQFWPERLARYIVSGAAVTPSPTSEGGRQFFELLQASGVAGGSKTPTEISAVIAKAKQFSDRDLHRWLGELELAGGTPEFTGRDMLDWDELQQMQSGGLVSTASHTVNHTRLRDSLDDDQTRHEIVDSQQEITRRLGLPAKLFCYPNGDVSAKAKRLVEQHYAGACTTASGWNNRNLNPFEIRRMTMHEGSAGTGSALVARISGLV